MRRVVLFSAALLLLCPLLIIYSCFSSFSENTESSMNPSRTRTVPLKLSKSSHIGLLYPQKLLWFLQKNALFVSAAGLVLVLFIVLVVYFVSTRHTKKDIILEDIVEEQEEELGIVGFILRYKSVSAVVLLVPISAVIYRLYLCRAPQDPIGIKFVNEEWYVPIPEALDELMKEILKRPNEELLFGKGVADIKFMYSPLTTAITSDGSGLVQEWVLEYNRRNSVKAVCTLYANEVSMKHCSYEYTNLYYVDIVKDEEIPLDLHAHALILLRFSQSGHASIIIVDHRRKVKGHYEIIYYDSLNMHKQINADFVKLVLENDAARCKVQEEYKYRVKFWSTPRQYNSADCVVFATTFAFFYLHTSFTYENMPFTHYDIAYFRRRFTALIIIDWLKGYLRSPENCPLFSNYPIDQLVHYFNLFIHFEWPEDVQFIVSKLEITDVEKIKTILKQSTDRNKLMNLLSHNPDMLAIAQRVLPEIIAAEAIDDHPPEEITEN